MFIFISSLLEEAVSFRPIASNVINEYKSKSFPCPQLGGIRRGKGTSELMLNLGVKWQ